MKWTVSRRIAAGYALLLVMMLIGGALASFALRRSAVVSEQALGTVRHRLVPATEAQSDWRRARVDYLRLLVQFEPTLIQSADSLVAAARTRLVSLRDSSTAEPQEQALWIEIIRDLDAWRVSAREIGELTRAGDATMPFGCSTPPSVRRLIPSAATSSAGSTWCSVGRTRLLPPAPR